MAAAALAPYWDRPGSSFAADHETEILTWNTTSRPQRGLVLGYSRTTVANAFREWGLRGTWIQASKGDPDKELVLSTIHGAKGAQADDVFLLPNKSLCQRARKRDLDALRVIYVALTRAKRRLYIPTSLKSALPR
jgi:superfamily I DNA and RNA helicase